MTDLQRNMIKMLREQGYGYSTVANAVGLKKDTVVAYCRKMKLTGKKADNDRVAVDTGFCLECAQILIHTPGKKHMKFCSNKCRTSWWNSHPEKVNRKANYSFTCAHCGKPFTAYGNSTRKYCCHDCYIANRFKGGDGNE